MAKIKKNYQINEKKKEIIIRSLTDLRQKEKEEVKFLVECGYTLKITNEAKPKKEPKNGFSKIELLYYLERKAPEDIVKEYIRLSDINYMKGFQWFKKWYKEQNNKIYEGEAHALIIADGAKAESRIKELQEIEAKKKEEKKKNK